MNNNRASFIKPQKQVIAGNLLAHFALSLCMRQVQHEEILRCKEHHSKTVGDVFERLHPSLISVCFRYLGNTDDAEDVVMVSWLKVLEKLKGFQYEHPLSFYAWIKRICINECLGILRHRINFHLVPIEDLSADDEPSYTDVDRIDNQLLLKLVAQLPEGYRTVFNLFALEGFSHSQIAKMLKIAESTSKSQLRKARLSLMDSIRFTQNVKISHEK